MFNDKFYIIPGLIMFTSKIAIVGLIIWYMLFVSKKIKQSNEKLDLILKFVEDLKKK